MAERNGWRLLLLPAILLVIAAIHWLVISAIVPKDDPPLPDNLPPGSTPENVTESAPKPTETVPSEVQPSKPPRHYRVKSTNPRFGQKFDYRSAIHGDALKKWVPGAENAKTGIIVDMDTRQVLWEKKSTTPVQIASMTKMMTLLLTFEELERNPQLSLDTEITIPPEALKVKRTGVLWLNPGEKFQLEEIIRGAAVKSANDAAETCAIIVSGNREKFLAKMNQRSRELGLTAKFTTSHGLPDEKLGASQACARDMVLLGERLLEYPDLMKEFSIQQSSIREGAKKTVFVNTNRLINPRYPGVDGMKTGYTKAAGFCLTFSVLRNGRRIMGCVTGFPSHNDRDRFVRKLIDWAYQSKK